MTLSAEDRNTVAFIKKLLEENYMQKQVSMITKEHPSRIQRIAAKKTFQYVDSEEYVENSFYEMNKKNLDIILSFPEIAGHGDLTEEDEHYIKLIKYCGGSYNDVRFMYADRPHWQLRNIWNKKMDFNLDKFDSTKIGIPKKELYFLMI